MSAKEELEKWAARHVSGVETLNFDHLLGAALTEARREMAHELAEKIRESWRGHYGYVISAVGANAARHWARGSERSADLIDPEVS